MEMHLRHLNLVPRSRRCDFTPADQLKSASRISDGFHALATVLKMPRYKRLPSSYAIASI